jgi:hypothetical protein
VINSLVRVCLLRVGIDTGSGGVLGPIWTDGTFEFVLIPETPPSEGGARTGPTFNQIIGRKGKALSTYAPRLSKKLAHTDPEFDTHTYGDYSPGPKSSLTNLMKGDLLAFYAGLKASTDAGRGALYLVGYFDIEIVSRSRDFSKKKLEDLYAANFHIRYRDFEEERRRGLILVKGSSESRLFKKAHLISKEGKNRAGKPVYVLSDRPKAKLGSFTKLNAIERSPPRWVCDEKADSAARWIRSLE